MEEQVCQSAPFNARLILPTHSQLIAVIAGFALAAFILLLTRDSDTDERARGNVIGALLLGLASVIGIVGAFLFSSVSGDHCMNSMLQFDTATAILAITALLMVAGITVAAGSQRQLIDTATALRVVLLIGVVIIGYRLFNDYVRSDSVSHQYATFIDDVERINERLPADERFRPGSVATLDRQLELYAQQRWPDRKDEWPGLLAEHFYRADTSTTTFWVMWAVVVIAVVWALVVRWVLTAYGRGPPGTGTSEAQPDRGPQVERLWRRWMSWLTVAGASTIVVLFSTTAATGMLGHPPTWQRVALFAAVTLLMGMIAQPPVVGDQRTVADLIRRRTRPPATAENEPLGP